MALLHEAAGMRRGSIGIGKSSSTVLRDTSNRLEAEQQKRAALPCRSWHGYGFRTTVTQSGSRAHEGDPRQSMSVGLLQSAKGHPPDDGCDFFTAWTQVLDLIQTRVLQVRSAQID